MLASFLPMVLVATSYGVESPAPSAERIDFRTDPAMIALSASGRLVRDVSHLERETCPGFDAIRNPASGPVETADAESGVKRLHARVDSCVERVHRDRYETMELFERTNPTAIRFRIRFRAGRATVARRAGESEWKTFTGDCRSARAAGGLFVTALERDGNLVRVAIEGFPGGLWYDHRKTFGAPLGYDDALGITSIFGQGGEDVDPITSKDGRSQLMPLRIDGEYGVFREYMSGTNTLKSGTVIRKKLTDLYAPDGRLEYVPASGC